MKADDIRRRGASASGSGMRLLIGTILTALAGCAQGQDHAVTAEPADAGSAVDGRHAPKSAGVALADAPNRFEYRQIVMAIEARIVLYAPDEAIAQRAANAAFARLNEIDASCSDYRPDSELMRLCAGGGGPAVPVSEDLWEILSIAKEVSAASGGAFEVSCGTQVDLWRRARASGVLPTPGKLSTAIQLSGPAALELNADGHAAALAAPGIRLDLGGIAKGYALGAAMVVLQVQGTPSAMIEMGGDLALGDPPPGEEGWRIQIGGASSVGATDVAVGDADVIASANAAGDAAHDATTFVPVETLVLSNAAVATSGDASQFVEIGGVRYGHIVDPRTGWALTNRLQSHVVFAQPPSGSAQPTPPTLPASTAPTRARAGALADALATAACVLGESEGRLLAEAFGASEVRFTRGQPQSLFDGRTLDGWTTRGGRYDGDAVWTVQDGCIVGRTGPGNAGGLIYTDTPHSSFELTLDCKLDHPFDSGVFVRMVPDARGAQLTLDDHPDGEIAGLYSDGWIQHAGPEAAAAWRVNEWNHLVLRCTGFDLHMQAWINGTKVLDATVPQEFGKNGKPVFAPRGLIGLQVHGGGSEAPDARARFRNISLRDLPVLGEESLVAGTHGWEELIASGTTGAAGASGATSASSASNASSASSASGASALAAWEAVDGEGLPRAPDDYRIVDGVLEIPSSQPSGYLRTKANFRDFAVRMDFRQAYMSNSGLFLRGRRETLGPDNVMGPGSNPAYSGCELQLLDDFHWESVTASTLHPYQFTASLYGAVAAGVLNGAAGGAAGGGAGGAAGSAPRGMTNGARTGAPNGAALLRPIGEWNTLEVLYRDSRLAVALNGLILYDVDTNTLNVDPPFSLRAPGGFIGLQRYGAPDVPGDTALRVRGMRVKRL